MMKMEKEMTNNVLNREVLFMLSGLNSGFLIHLEIFKIILLLLFSSLHV